jgi:hypothetical protein
MGREAGEAGGEAWDINMLTRIIDQRMTLVAHQLRHDPTSKIEDMLDMDKAQTDVLWSLDFGSIRNLKGMRPPMSKFPLPLPPVCLIG